MVIPLFSTSAFFDAQGDKTSFSLNFCSQCCNYTVKESYPWHTKTTYLHVHTCTCSCISGYCTHDNPGRVASVDVRNVHKCTVEPFWNARSNFLSGTILEPVLNWLDFLFWVDRPHCCTVYSAGNSGILRVCASIVPWPRL